MAVIESLLTIKQVAKLIGKGDGAVRRMVSSGTIPEPLRLSRALRFRASVIDRWIRLGCPSRDEFDAIREEVQK